ncbi:MAG: ketoacyl-ACP synthase III [Psychromonas sp.]|nr:ketoacyl-ACP synthase III [Psychromonas sp.]
MYFAQITGWGKCLPETVLTNDELSTFVDTNDKWIQSRTGIKTRRISHVETSDMATVAAEHAIAAAGITAQDIDLIIIATCSPDTLIPNIASKVQANIQASNSTSFDLNAACTGFLYALEIATNMIRMGNYKHAVIIGAERLSFYLNWSKRDTAVLFGDGAGAVVLSQTTTKTGLLVAKLGCDSKGRDSLSIPYFGTAMDRFSKNNGNFSFNFDGKDIFKNAVKAMNASSHKVLQEAQLSVGEIDVVIPHQANRRIIDSFCDFSGIAHEKVIINIEKYGNTSAATVPIALCEAVETGRIKPYNKILSAAFGAGLTWGAAYIQWGERTNPINTCDAALPECKQTATELLEKSIAYCQRTNML